MKKNDDLLRLAFGDLNADAARAVEAQAAGDAAATREIEALRDLRASLQLLPPPPPDNLSAERLRAAILDRELRARRPTPFSWAWAPLALAAFAGVVLFVRPAPRSDPQIVTLPGVHRDEIAMNVPEFKPTYPAYDPAETADIKVKAPAPPVARQRKTSAPRSRASAPTFSAPAVDLLEAAEPKFAMVEPQTIATPPSAVVASAPGEPGDDTIVVVSSKRDLETGALAATETEASNVLVGG